MSDLVKKDKRATSITKFEAAQSRKRYILSQPEVCDGLTIEEFDIAEKGLKLSVREYQEADLVQKLAILTKMTCRDLGIKTWNNPEILKYDSARFYNILKSFYSNLTLEEVKHAFILLSVGKLDEYFPKGKDGFADKNHYQQFSVDFLSKVLNAYGKYRSKVWSKAQKLVPIPEKTISEDEKEQSHDWVINDIVMKFMLYKDHGQKSKFVVPDLIVKELKKAGLIKDLPDVDQSDIDQAFFEMMTSNTVSAFVKDTIRQSRQSENIHPMIQAKAKRKVKEREIFKVFDQLIELDTALADLLR